MIWVVLLAIAFTLSREEHEPLANIVATFLVFGVGLDFVAKLTHQFFGKAPIDLSPPKPSSQDAGFPVRWVAIEDGSTRVELHAMTRPSIPLEDAPRVVDCLRDGLLFLCVAETEPPRVLELLHLGRSIVRHQAYGYCVIVPMPTHEKTTGEPAREA